MSLVQPFLAFAFQTSTHEIGLGSFFSGLRCRNLRLCLIDSGKRFSNSRVLQFALTNIVLDGGPGSLDGCIRLVNLRLKVVVLQLNQEVSFVYLLIVGDVNRADNAGNLGAKRGEVAANVSVVGNLFRLAAFPGIPVPGNSNQEGESE